MTERERQERLHQYQMRSHAEWLQMRIAFHQEQQRRYEAAGAGTELYDRVAHVCDRIERENGGILWSS